MFLMRDDEPWHLPLKKQVRPGSEEWVNNFRTLTAMHPGRSIFSENTKIPEQEIRHHYPAWGVRHGGTGNVSSLILPVLLIYCPGKGITMKDRGLFIMFG
jgi:hypothetical protein